MPGSLWKAQSPQCTVSAVQAPKAATPSHDLPHHGKTCARCKEAKPRSAFGNRVVGGRTYAQAYCRDCLSGYVQRWQGDPDKRPRMVAAQRASKARHHDRELARWSVWSRLRKGRLVPGACVRADDDCRGPIQAHHDDYSKRLEVVWACRRHHGELDRERRERAA